MVGRVVLRRRGRASNVHTAAASPAARGEAAEKAKDYDGHDSHAGYCDAGYGTGTNAAVTTAAIVDLDGVSAAGSG